MNEKESVEMLKKLLTKSKMYRNEREAISVVLQLLENSISKDVIKENINDRENRILAIELEREKIGSDILYSAIEEKYRLKEQIEFLENLLKEEKEDEF